MSQKINCEKRAEMSKKKSTFQRNSWPRTNPSSDPSSCPEISNVKLQELVAPHLGSFNFMLEEGLSEAVSCLLPAIIEDQNGGGVKLWIEDAQIETPSKDGSLETRLFPNECRERGLSYVAPLVVTLCRSIVGTSATERIHKSVGDIPIMIRSSKCHLHNLSTRELIEAREEANEFGGYFICNGNERCVRLLQMPRRHHIMAISRPSFQKRGASYSDKAVVIRCVRRDQSAVTITLHYLLDGNATIRFGIRKQEFMIPVVLLLKAIYPLTDREIFERVLCGDNKNTYLSTRLELLLRDCKRFNVYTREEALSYLGQHFRPVLPYINDSMTNLQIGSQLIDEYIFVHISKGEKGYAQKAELLFLMIRKLYGFAKGDVHSDNPDSLMNHELLLPGHLYLMILKEKLQDMLNTLKQGILKEITLSDRVVQLDRIDTILVRKIWDKSIYIGKAMTYFLNTGNLKSSSGLDLMQVAGYTIVAEKLNYYRYLSHYRSVHRGQFFTTMKTTTVRKLLPDSWGFLCPVHTPDGSPCGLLNHLAVECKLITHPVWKANEYIEKEQILAEFLTRIGMSPGTGIGDASLVLPYYYMPIMLNGKVIGGATIEDCTSIAKTLRYYKTVEGNDGLKRGIHPSMEVCLILPIPGGPFPGLFLSVDVARMTRPVKQLESGGIELIAPMEQVFMEIACEKDDITLATTHQELDPTNILSLVASLTPFSDYNQSPRNMYQCQMAKQTMATPCHSFEHRTDNKMYRIQTPQSPLVQNRRLSEYSLDEYPLGTNAVVAVISYTGYDMEDAMIINKSSYERGFAHASVYKNNIIDIKTRNGTVKYEFSNLKDEKKDRDNQEEKILFTDKLDIDGLPRIGQIIHYDEPLCSYVDNTTGEVKFVKHKESEPAIVDQIRCIGGNQEDKKGSQYQNTAMQKVAIKLRFCRNPVVGDKFSSRHGQKGVLSILWPQVDMPFSESGISPDIIINPHAFPSRMTIGMLIESMAAKAGSLHGIYQDSTPFRFHEKNRVIDYFGHQLVKAGYHYMGSEPLYSGLTGTIMHADIYMGIVYYQRLRHMVSDKSQVRSTGPNNQLTRQPVKGRKKKGGIRFGEMERDSLLAHGCAYLLYDRLVNCSDKHIGTVCTKCGSLLSTLTQRASVISSGSSALAASAHSRSQILCVNCGTGEKCVQVAMPYVFRYLANELAAMNIKVTLGVKAI